jgi:nucleoside-diphosphate-sugar epimerase
LAVFRDRIDSEWWYILTGSRKSEEKTLEESLQSSFIIAQEDVVLVTGASGFIGPSVVRRLFELGFHRVRCLVRSASRAQELRKLCDESKGQQLQLVTGNLLSREDCLTAAEGAAVVLHLAASGSRSYPDAYMNSVVTTRNLLEACVQHGCLKRFVNVSSFAVYDIKSKSTGNLLDEHCPVEAHPETRGEAYCFAKAKQDEMVAEYGLRHQIPYVTVRPGVVYGPGKLAITGRVGIDTFGFFLHLGGSNRIPFTYVDNCANAIVLAGIQPGVEGEIFNVLDDDLPTSRQFLRLYKRQVKRFHSLYLPKIASYLLCSLWERYSSWSKGQLPPSFNRSRWYCVWKKTRYTNEKLKKRLGWQPVVSTQEGLRRYFEACRAGETHG